MSEIKNVEVTVDEARIFAARLGLAWVEGPHLEALATAMTTMNAAGKSVSRVPTKQVQPAQAFRVAGKLPRT
jgi:hypothetical protein